MASAPAFLLMAQRIDRVERGGALGRDVAEQYAEEGGEDQAAEIDQGVEDEVDRHQLGQQQRQAEGESDSDRAAERAEHHRLGEELQPDLARERADRQPDADLASP